VAGQSCREGQGNTASYNIRISERPIVNKDDFGFAKDVVINFKPVLKYRREHMAVDGLEPGKLYYFAMEVQNNVYNTSVIAVAQAQANSTKNEIIAMDEDVMDFGIEDWKSFSSPNDGAVIKSVSDKDKTVLDLKYTFNAAGQWHWAGISKSIERNLPEKYKFKFYVKSAAVKMNVEFKLIDRSGSVFGYRLEKFNFNGDWQQISVDSINITYWWGGKGGKTISALDKIEIAFSAAEKGEGNIEVNKLTFIK